MQNDILIYFNVFAKIYTFFKIGCNPTRFMKANKHLLQILTVIIIIVNLAVMIYYGTSINRWLRFANMCIFLLLFITPYYYNKKGLLVMCLFLICDALLINYESDILNGFVFIIRGSCFLLLAGMVSQRVRKLKTNLFQKIIFTLAIALNAFLLYSLIEMVPSARYYSFFDFLFYLYGMAVIICATIAVSYSNRYANKNSLFFLMAILGLVFSDLTYFIGFYLKFYEFYLADIVFDILGISLIIQFFLLEKSTGEISDPELME